MKKLLFLMSITLTQQVTADISYSVTVKNSLSTPITAVLNVSGCSDHEGTLQAGEQRIWSIGSTLCPCNVIITLSNGITYKAKNNTNGTAGTMFVEALPFTYAVQKTTIPQYGSDLSYPDTVLYHFYPNGATGRYNWKIAERIK